MKLFWYRIFLVVWSLIGGPITDSVLAGESIRGTTYVRDGDTVVVAGQPVRLKGVDAEEMRTVRGRAAKQVMIDIIGGADVVCDLTGEKTWDRKVGFCRVVGGVDIGREIIARGWALACPRYSTRYVAFETASAREEQRRASYCGR